MTVFGLGTKLRWSWIEKYARRTCPFAALASPESATAQKSAFMVSHRLPITPHFSRSTWSHGMLGLVILMAMLSEMLVVVLNTVPFTTTTAYRAFKVSVYINSVILSLIIATVTAVLFWIVRLQKSGIIPEVPECNAGPFEMVDNDDRWHCLGGLNGRERERQDRKRLGNKGRSPKTGWRVANRHASMDLSSTQ
jgi:hypothetical protein